MLASHIVLPGQLPCSNGATNGQHVSVAPVTLEAFKLVDGKGATEWTPNFVYRFALALFLRSRYRRLAAGAEGLMVEAAQLAIRLMLPNVIQAYRDRSMAFRMTDAAQRRLANELASEMAALPALQTDTLVILDYLLNQITKDEQWAETNAVLERGNAEGPKQSLGRMLDYVEYLRIANRYDTVFDLHRLLLTCSRVSVVVFGR